MRRFRYDAKHDLLNCPRGKILKAGRAVKHGRFFTSRATDCKRCDLRSLCLSKGRANKAVVVGDHPALLRARRREALVGSRLRALSTPPMEGARVFTARPKPGMGSRVPSGVACQHAYPGST